MLAHGQKARPWFLGNCCAPYPAPGHFTAEGAIAEEDFQ